MRQEVKGPNTLNGVRNGFGPTVYSRDLKIAAMRAVDTGATWRDCTEVSAKSEAD